MINQELSFDADQVRFWRVGYWWFVSSLVVGFSSMFLGFWILRGEVTNYSSGIKSVVPIAVSFLFYFYLRLRIFQEQNFFLDLEYPFIRQDSREKIVFLGKVVDDSSGDSKEREILNKFGGRSIRGFLYLLLFLGATALSGYILQVNQLLGFFPLLVLGFINFIIFFSPFLIQLRLLSLVLLASTAWAFQDADFESHPSWLILIFICGAALIVSLHFHRLISYLRLKKIEGPLRDSLNRILIWPALMNSFFLTIGFLIVVWMVQGFFPYQISTFNSVNIGRVAPAGNKAPSLLPQKIRNRLAQQIVNYTSGGVSASAGGGGGNSGGGTGGSGSGSGGSVSGVGGGGGQEPNLSASASRSNGSLSHELERGRETIGRGRAGDDRRMDNGIQVDNQNQTVDHGEVGLGNRANPFDEKNQNDSHSGELIPKNSTTTVDPNSVNSSMPKLVATRSDIAKSDVAMPGVMKSDATRFTREAGTTETVITTGTTETSRAAGAGGADLNFPMKKQGSGIGHGQTGDRGYEGFGGKGLQKGSLNHAFQDSLKNIAGSSSDTRNSEDSGSSQNSQNSQNSESSEKEISSDRANFSREGVDARTQVPEPMPATDRVQRDQIYARKVKKWERHLDNVFDGIKKIAVLGVLIGVVSLLLVFFERKKESNDPGKRQHKRFQLRSSDRNRLRQMFEFLKKHMQGDQKEIIQTYTALLEVFRAADYARDPSLPVDRYSREIDKKLPLIGPDFCDATNVFSKTLYGEKAIDEKGIKSFRKNVEQILTYFRI